MYTSYIGKKFLKYYNEKEKKNYTAKEFFDEVMFPIFFDAPIFLMWVHNSPFDQLNKESSKKRKDHLRKKEKIPYVPLLEIASERKRKKEELLDKISRGEISGSNAVGYPVFDPKGNTSGQITEMKREIDSEELISSWIGQALAIGLKGGYILIDKMELLYQIFLGWSIYRKFIERTPNVKGNQIETWNAHWLKEVTLKEESITINNFLFIPPIERKDNSDILFLIPSLKWSSLILILAKVYPEEILMCYSYVLGKMNKTYGFINMYLPEVSHLYEIRDRFFIDARNTVLTDKQIIMLEPFYDFFKACKKGTLGLSSLEPKGLRDYLPTGSYKYSKGKKIKISEKNYTIYLIYKLWVIAMLKKTELLKLAEEFASILIGHKKSEDKENNRGKTVKYQEVKNLLDSRSVRLFIEKLTDIMNTQNENKDLFKKVVEEVLKMPIDNFPLFVTLVKFEYTYQK